MALLITSTRDQRFLSLPIVLLITRVDASGNTLGVRYSLVSSFRNLSVESARPIIKNHYRLKKILHHEESSFLPVITISLNRIIF